MIILFWAATLLLLSCAFLFILPWIRSGRLSILIAVVIGGATFGLYSQWGSSRHLQQYYSSQEKLQRMKQNTFRPLWVAFRKEEFRLRLRLEENPHDLDAEWRLFDLLAIKAVSQGDTKLALQYWELVLNKMPDIADSQPIKARILEQLRHFRP